MKIQYEFDEQNILTESILKEESLHGTFHVLVLLKLISFNMRMDMIDKGT